MNIAESATHGVMITAPEHQAKSSRGALASLALAMLLSSLGTSIANVAVPALTTAFAAPFAQVQWVVLAYLLVITTLIVSVGRLGDIIGRRRLLLTGIGLFTVASALCGLAPSLWFLVGARALQGAGAAIMMALAMALVAKAIPKEQTGRAMALLGTMSAVGTALGPSLGGVLLAVFTWRAIFFVSLPLGVLTLLLAHHFLPADPRALTRRRTEFDAAGALLLTATLTAYALAVTLTRGSFGVLNAGLLLAATAGIALLALVESKAVSPLIDLTLFRDPILRAGFVMSMLVTTVVMTTLVVGPFYLSGALALDAARVGVLMSSGPVIAAAATAPSGRVVDRFGASAAIMLGLSGMLSGCLGMVALPARVGIAGYLISLAAITAGYALFQTANNTGVMTTGRPAQAGVVAGLLGLSRNLGLITGVAVMGAVFARATGGISITTARPEGFVHGMRVAFIVGAMLIVVALVVAQLARPDRNGTRRS
jgi:MFS family permease